MLTKRFNPTQVCILLFSNNEKGNRGADTYRYFQNVSMVAARAYCAYCLSKTFHLGLNGAWPATC